MTEEKRKEIEDRLKGVEAGLNLAIAILELQQRYQQQQRLQARRRAVPSKPKYDLLDHVCGISLMDKMMGI